MRHDGLKHKRRDQRWHKHPRRIYKRLKRLQRLCLMLLLITTLFYITNLTLLYLNIKLPDFLNIEIPFKLIQTKSDNTSDDSNPTNTPESSVAPINSVTPIVAPTISPTIELTVAPIVTVGPTPSLTPRPTLAPTETPSLTPTVLVSSTSITTSSHTKAASSTTNAIPSITPTIVASSTTSILHTSTIAPIATPTKEIVTDPFSYYRPITKINLTNFLISDIYNSKKHTLSDSNVTFSIEEDTLFIASNTYFVDISYSVSALETLANFGIKYINIQDFTILNASFMIKEFDAYDIKTFHTYWKENNGRYEVNITFDQSLLSMLFNGVCVFDLTKLNP